jgi:ubiquitin C-terminal hydrolase
LSAICYNNPENLTKVIDKLSSFHKLGYWRSKRYYDWNISQLTEEKSSTGFVGLKNLGCICYMNSLMQQFFMIPSLRESILQSENEQIETQSESVLYQLKKIFSFLKASDRQYHNPKDFCSNFKNWEMQPINIYEQMDVDEFYNLLIDRLETSLKQSKNHNIFKDHFLGKLSNELICKGCPHYSEREETYFNLPLQVKNKKSIQESLEAFVQGEMLEGDNAYFCEKCDKKVNTLRRVCIKDLPKHLIIVLKRFEFDYDTMQKIKVNDFCEFPKELNMEPYTQEYLSYIEKNKEKQNKKDENDEEEIIVEKTHKGENYYKYDLSGVIIHTGFADSGHYYSIIKDTNNSNWYEFNDTHVRFYDVNDLHNEAFGGQNKQGKGHGGEKLTNAYVLFYKRKEETDNEKKIVVDEEVGHNQVNIQNDILELVKQDNYQYWVSKILFSNVYFEFIQDILVNYNTDVSNHYFKNGNLKNLSEHSINRHFLINRNIPESAFSVIKYNKNHLTNASANQKILASSEFENFLFRFCALSFFTTILRSRDKNMVPNFMDIMKGFINKSYVNSDWLLEEFANEEILFEYLIDCPIIEIKRLSTGILAAALFKSYSHHKGNLASDSSLISFVNAIVFLVGRSNKHFTKDFSYINFLLYRISKLSSEMAIYLNTKKVALFIILSMYNKNNLLQSTIRNLSNENLIPSNFALESVLSDQIKENRHKDIYSRSILTKEKLTPFEEFSEKKILEKLDKSPAYYESYLFMTLSEIMLKCPVFSDEERYLLKLDNKLTMKIFLNDIKNKQSSIVFSKLYAFACRESVEITNFVLNELTRVFEQYEFNDLEHHSRLLIQFLLIEDSLKEKRVS